MRKLVLLLLILTTRSVFAQGPDIDLRGECPLSKHSLRSIYLSSEKDSLGMAAIADTLAALAFPEAHVELESKGNRSSLAVHTGPRYTIGKITIIGDSISKSIEKDLVREHSGEPATAAVISRIAMAIVHYLSNSGHPFAQASVEQIDLLEECTVGVVFLGVPGPLSSFTECAVTGVDKGTARYLSRVAGIEAGNRFSDDEIVAARRRIATNRFIEVEDSAALEFRNEYSDCKLTFHAKAKPSNLVEGSFGYQPRVRTTKGYVKGYIRAEFENILRRGRVFSLFYNKKDPFSHELSFGFYQPFLFYRPISVSISISQIKYDSLYQQLALEATGEYTSIGPTSIRISTGWSKYTPIGSKFLGVFHSRKLWWGLGTTLNSSVGRLEQSLDLDVKYGVKQQYSFAGVKPAGSRIDDTRITGKYRASTSISASLLLSSVIEGGAIVTDEAVIPPTDLFRLGGALRLRGYREDQFFTDKFLSGSIQPQIGISAGAGVRLFADVAWFRMPSGESVARIGSGAGLVFGLATGELVMDIAWGKDDKFGDGKFYVRLESRF
jgi:outer membrane protein assembly factor BamA